MSTKLPVIVAPVQTVNTGDRVYGRKVKVVESTTKGGHLTLHFYRGESWSYEWDDTVEVQRTGRPWPG